jgi:hypothetical protein
MYKNGVVVNPLKVKSPPSAPVSSKHLAEFKQTVNMLAARFENQAPVQTARLDNATKPSPSENQALAN